MPGGRPRPPERLRALESVAGAVRPVTLANQRLLPVEPALAGLFPEGGVRRGSVVSLAPAAGATSLALAVTAAASRAGSWVATVGSASLGMLAAAQLGVDLSRFAVVERPGDEWPTVTAALVDGVDFVVVRPPVPVGPSLARRLAARARERGAVIVALPPPWGRSRATDGGRYSPWPGGDIHLEPRVVRWEGLGEGWGHLSGRVVEVASAGRRSAGRSCTVRVMLPGADGGVGSLASTGGAVAPEPEASVEGRLVVPDAV